MAIHPIPKLQYFTRFKTLQLKVFSIEFIQYLKYPIQDYEILIDIKECLVKWQRCGSVEGQVVGSILQSCKFFFIFQRALMEAGILTHTITQHTFADTFQCRQRAPLPTDNLPRKVLPTIQKQSRQKPLAKLLPAVNRIPDTLCVGKRSTQADS